MWSKGIIAVGALLILLGVLNVPKLGSALAVNRLASEAAMHCGGAAYRGETGAATSGGSLANNEQALWLAAVQARCEGLDEVAVSRMHDTLGVSDARLAMARKFYPYSVELARFAAQRYPARPDAHSWLGDALSKNGDTQGAIEQYRRGVEIAPEDANAWMSLGSLYQEQGDTQNAISAFEEACTYVDDLKNGCRWAGKLYMKLGQNEKAAERFNTAIKQLGDRWAPLERDLADALLAQGKTEEAIPHLEYLAKHGSEDARQKLDNIQNK